MTPASLVETRARSVRLSSPTGSSPLGEEGAPSWWAAAGESDCCCSFEAAEGEVVAFSGEVGAGRVDGSVKGGRKDQMMVCRRCSGLARSTAPKMARASLAAILGPTTLARGLTGRHGREKSQTRGRRCGEGRGRRTGRRVGGRRGGRKAAGRTRGGRVERGGGRRGGEEEGGERREERKRGGRSGGREKKEKERWMDA